MTEGDADDAHVVATARCARARRRAARPGALADAMTRGWRPYRWRGYAVGVVAGLALGGIVAPILTTSVALGLALAGITVDPRVPWAEVVWSVTFVVTFAAVGAWAVARWLPAAFRDALESYVWIARREPRPSGATPSAIVLFLARSRRCATSWRRHPRRRRQPASASRHGWRLATSTRLGAASHR